MGACLRARLEMIFSTQRLKEEMGAHLEGRLEMLSIPAQGEGQPIMARCNVIELSDRKFFLFSS